MNRLFVRTFLAMWLASALIGVGIAAVEVVRQAPTEASADDRIARRLIALEGQALLALDQAGAEEHRAWLETQTGLRLVIFGPHDEVVVGDASDAIRRLARRARADPDVTERAYDAELSCARLEGGYMVVARRPARPTWARALATDTFAVRAVIVLLVSAGIAFGLARWLSRPLDRLRSVTRIVADGDLATRASGSLGDAPAEVEALARDFDTMVARVEALVASRDQLLSDVSHELGSPLARLRVALELARSHAGESAAPMLDRIELEAERLAELVDEILTLHRLETKSPIASDEVELGSLIDEITGDASFEAIDAGVELVVAVADELRVTGDRELLRRAIENVVRNACRHAPKETEVEVTLSREGKEAVVAIRDHGPGVPVDDRERIFEPLVRLDASRDRGVGGRGLGLAIAKRAVEAHGGSISAHETPGGGLTVTLRLLPHEPSHELT